jgi:MFS transporter, PAT family, beta-lactamase induction signal transducer AmpG
VSRLREIINNPRVVAALTLGFASGFPVNLPGSTLQAWAASIDVDLNTIGWLTLASAPYTFKLFWAPFMDRYVPPLLGRRRGWILLLQLALAGAIALMGLNPPDERLYAISALALLAAFFSASQDIVIDAYRADALRVEERGPGSAMTQLGYRIAGLLSGSIALILSEYIGWRNTYFTMALVMALTVLFTLRAPEPEIKVTPPRTLLEAVVGPLRDFFSRNGAWVLLSLILLYKLGDAFALSLLSTFLIKGVGFTAFEVGAYSKTTYVISTFLGVLVGGAALARLNLWKALMIFGILQAVTNLAYAALAAAGKHVGVMVMAVGFDNFVGGMGAVAFMAFLMSLCNVRFSAAQYALLSALALVPRTFIGPPAAWLADSIGWQGLYIVTFLAALPGLAMLWWLRTRIDASNPAQENDG